MDNYEDFIIRLKTLMAQKSWKVSDLAANTGLNQSTTHNMFKESRKMYPYGDHLYLIAKVFDTSMEYLMTGKEPQVKEVIEDPVKKELIDYIKDIDHDFAVEIRAMIKTMHLMTLKKAFKDNDSE